MGDFTKDAYQIIYQHPDWQSTAQDYEDQFAANLYQASYVQQAASTALTRLSNVLTTYYQVKRLDTDEARGLAAVGEVAEEVSGRSPADWRVLEETLLRRNSGEGAGQIGRWELGDYASELDLERLEAQESYPLFQPDADQLNWENIAGVLEDGNLREQMTMLYNGMFLNGGMTKEEIAESRSLKNLLLNVTEEDQERMNERGAQSNIRFDLLREMGHYEKKEDLFDTYSMARDLKRGKDRLKGRGSALTRWASGIKRAFRAAFSSVFTRKKKKESERIGLGREHYEELGMGLSEREMANGLDEQGNLKWKEGQAYYRMDTPVTAEGMLQTAGPSGTTLRMMGAYKLLGASKNELMFFRLALIAWMVGSRDHSLYEVLQGSHNAGIKGDEDLSEAANMYRTVDPLEEGLIRDTLTSEGYFPHEIIFMQMMDEYLEKSGEDPVIDEREDSNRAYQLAVKAYTGDLYAIINTGDKYGDLAARLALFQMVKGKRQEEEEERLEMEREAKEKGELIPPRVDRRDSGEASALDAFGFNIAKISARFLQEGLEERGGEETPGGLNDKFATYDKDEGETNRNYRDLWMQGGYAFRGTTYRGGKLTSDMKKAGAFVTDGFLSTSMLPGVALNFYNATNENEKNKAIFRFRLDGMGSVSIGNISSVAKEKEVLIPKGTTLLVHDKPKAAFYNRESGEFKEKETLSEEELAQIELNIQNEGESTWVKCQLVDIDEINGPGIKRQDTRAVQKRLKRLREMERLSDLREAHERRRERAG